MNSVPEQNSEALSGLVERVTYHNAENGYCVLRVKVRGNRDLITVVGHASLISAGENVQALGRWINDRNYGSQFKAHFLKAVAPTTEEGIEKYLGSGMIKGIGPVYAKKLVQAFGSDVFEVIENSPERLLTVDGIGPHRSTIITKGWADQKMIREIMLFLHQHGISTARAVRIHKIYGNEAIQIITENPYRLARDIRGIGFLSADKIAEKVGIARDSLVRAQAGLNHALLEALDEGHCGLPQAELLKMTCELLEVSSSIVETALSQELLAGDLISNALGEGSQGIFLKGLYLAEKNSAALLKTLALSQPPWGSIDVSSAVPWVEGRLNITLSESQKAAIKLALSSKVMVITGGPGVGKTTLVKSLIEILKAKKIRIQLCAPTGRAAKRLNESTGLEAKTIHRLLETDPMTGSFKRGPENLLECDVLIVDESSMVDVTLMYSILKALPQEAALILIGDVDQLPSVGPGQVLCDIIKSHSLPVARLTEIFRQAATSHIIMNAHRVNQGQMPLIPKKDEDSDFYFVEAETPEDCVHKILEITSQRIPKKWKWDPVQHIQILCPMNRGGVGARSINIELQQTLNPSQENKIERFGWTYYPGDKVMQISNNYDKDVYNGDMGYVRDLNADLREMTISFEGRDVVYDFDELDEVVLSYATTIHKSQGSEYPVVIIPLMTQHYTMLKRNLLYTGITRGKNLVVLVGQKKALAMAVKDRNTKQRYTKLKDWLNIGAAVEKGI